MLGSTLIDTDSTSDSKSKSSLSFSPDVPDSPRPSKDSGHSRSSFKARLKDRRSSYGGTVKHAILSPFQSLARRLKPKRPHPTFADNTDSEDASIEAPSSSNAGPFDDVFLNDEPDEPLPWTIIKPAPPFHSSIPPTTSCSHAAAADSVQHATSPSLSLLPPLLHQHVNLPSVEAGPSITDAIKEQVPDYLFFAMDEDSATTGKYNNEEHTSAVCTRLPSVKSATSLVWSDVESQHRMSTEITNIPASTKPLPLRIDTIANGSNNANTLSLSAPVTTSHIANYQQYKLNAAAAHAAKPPQAPRALDAFGDAWCASQPQSAASALPTFKPVPSAHPSFPLSGLMYDVDSKGAAHYRSPAVVPAAPPSTPVTPFDTTKGFALLGDELVLSESPLRWQSMRKLCASSHQVRPHTIPMVVDLESRSPLLVPSPALMPCAPPSTPVEAFETGKAFVLGDKLTLLPDPADNWSKPLERLGSISDMDASEVTDKKPGISRGKTAAMASSTVFPESDDEEFDDAMDELTEAPLETLHQKTE
ncbi:hypothetical protein SeLEV6574_g06616 [Synchytrium endobioticum]|uniref:Uncharacterized protein n=1 Tax=Synchytrium endobioticum TaxID=286115 RepID=A0A507CFZ5_9FUNG|nr:hypothetical protein SeLEV6574_g06616 [Synchytrium endobioticum]